MGNIHRNKQLPQLPAAQWDERLRQDLADYVNYRISGGSLRTIAKNTDAADSIIEPILDSAVVRAYRQAQHGV